MQMHFNIAIKCSHIWCEVSIRKIISVIMGKIFMLLDVRHFFPNSSNGRFFPLVTPGFSFILGKPHTMFPPSSVPAAVLSNDPAWSYDTSVRTWRGRDSGKTRVCSHRTCSLSELFCRQACCTGNPAQWPFPGGSDEDTRSGVQETSHSLECMLLLSLLSFLET